MAAFELKELESSTLQLIKTFKDLPNIKDSLIDIVADGTIDDKERPQMEDILIKLEKMKNKIQSLKLVYQKQIGGYPTNGGKES